MGSLLNYPSGSQTQWTPLVEYRRSGITENTFFGALAIVKNGKLIKSVSAKTFCYGRSLMKPFFIRPFAKELEFLNWKQKASALASHNGSPNHVASACSILLPEHHDLLQVPIERPLLPEEPFVDTPTRWHHNSSGEHAAVLRGLIEKKLDPKNYLDPNHFVFQSHLKEVKKALPLAELKCFAEDGDGLPTLALSVKELAFCYGHLAESLSKDWIWEAFCKEPYYIGGKGRLDTAINNQGKGEVIAKEGADGLLGMALKKDSVGVAIKIAHGWSPHATWLVAQSILSYFGVGLSDPPVLKKQKAFLTCPLFEESQ